jgi:hypothetical protein
MLKHNPPPWLRAWALKNPRAAGLVVMLIGGGLLYFLVLIPIQQAQHHADHVQISMKATVAGTAFLCFGVVQTILGSLLRRLIEPSAGGSKLAAWIVAIISCGMGFAAHEALESYLRNLGYSV